MKHYFNSLGVELHVHNANIKKTRKMSSILEKRPVISLYWFASQQPTSTFRRQKYASFYSKFNNAESDELDLRFQKKDRKWLKNQKLKKPNRD